MLRVEQISPRRRQVLEGVAAGKSNGVIAQELGMTLDGVKWHVSELLGETGYASRAELAAWWQRETAPRAAPVWLPRRAVSHPLAAGVARVAAIFAVAAALAAGIAAVARSGARVPTAPTHAVQDRLAYVQGGDLWVKTLPDGPPRRITTDGQAGGPRWSASGKWLAYDDGSDAWIARADGSDARTVAGFSGWSPTDDRYAGVDTTSDSNGRIQVFTENADGSNRRVTVSYVPSSGHVTWLVRKPLWSPDGRWLAYTILGQGIPELPARQVTVSLVSAAGGTPTMAYDAGSPSRDDVVLVGWSPDGHAVFFALDPSFSASALADGLLLQAILVLPASYARPSLRPFAPGPATVLLGRELWQPSPVGSLIAITDGGGRETWRNKRIALVSWASGTVVDLTGTSIAAIQPAWSPDMARIAYVAAPDAGVSVSGGDPARQAMAQRKIWLMGADGAHQRQLTSDPAYRDERPVWTGDGTHILFARLDANDRASLWLVPAAGGVPTRVVDNLTPPPAQEGAPTWFGYYGRLGWDSTFALWPSAPGR